MERFFEDIAANRQIGDRLSLSPDNTRHFISSLRGKLGDVIVVCDGAGMDYFCEVLGIDKKTVSCNIISREENSAEPSYRLTLFQALPKADKMEFIIQKATELGVSEIVPVITEFTVSRPERGKWGAKRERFKKIAESAAKQCGRGIIPEIGEILEFPDCAKKLTAMSFPIVCYENETKNSIKGIFPERVDEVGVFIGPEGGFSESEINTLKIGGAKSVSISKRVLRVETAVIAALSIINFELGDVR